MRLRSLLLSFLLSLWIMDSAWAAAPSRTYTYVTGQTIDPSQVTTNEDGVFSYLQAGVDTYAAGTVNTAALADNAVTSAKIASGAVDAVKMATTGTIADDKVFVADSATAATWRTIPNATGSSFLQYTQSTNSFSATALPIASRVLKTNGNFTTTSTSLTNITTLSITLTTKANPVVICLSGAHQNTGANLNFFDVTVDSTGIIGSSGLRYGIPTATTNFGVSFCVMSAALTAASHTFVAQMGVTAGTGQLTCPDTTEACSFSVVEVSS